METELRGLNAAQQAPTDPETKITLQQGDVCQFFQADGLAKKNAGCGSLIHFWQSRF